MKSVLITGANRGLGLGLVKAFLNAEKIPKRIIALCREPERATDLSEISKLNSNIHILQFDATKFELYKNVHDEVRGIVKEDGLNCLINNAGISQKFVRLAGVKNEHLVNSFIVNTVAPIALTKELLPLLKVAAKQNGDLPLGSSRAAVVNMSSILGSIDNNKDGGQYPYRCSKSALNSATKSMSIDLLPYDIIATCLHPGWVKTSMGGPKAPMEVEESCRKLVKVIYGLNKEHSGSFLSYDGSTLPWDSTDLFYHVAKWDMPETDNR